MASFLDSIGDTIKGGITKLVDVIAPMAGPLEGAIRTGGEALAGVVGSGIGKAAGFIAEKLGGTPAKPPGLPSTPPNAKEGSKKTGPFGFNAAAPATTSAVPAPAKIGLGFLAVRLLMGR